MTQNAQAIETEIGIIRGRDAIFLDSIDLNYSSKRISFRGAFNPHLCSKTVGSDEFIGFDLSFSGLLALRMIELDFDVTNGKSSFDEITNSDWLKQIKCRDHSAKLSAAHRHFVLATYDDVFEIIADHYEIRLSVEET